MDLRQLTTSGHFVSKFSPGDVIFAQGDACDSVAYVSTGTVRLSVGDAAGKEAIVGMLRDGAFIGEGAVAGQLVRTETATAVSTFEVVIVPKGQIVRLLNENREFADLLLKHMLTRTMRLQQDLVDQCLHSSEKRLARALLLLAGGPRNEPAKMLPPISQDTLAEMVGTSRSRVNRFLNSFKKRGLISYERYAHGVVVHRALRDVIATH
jgi:CRP/FNR family cyclic AMP-dependent transcriptional regulator